MASSEPSVAVPSHRSASKLDLTIKVSAFRAYRDDASLTLRPLTLLYGHNQSGKSSLLRLVSLISDSLRTNVRALDMQSPSLRRASFKELCWMGKDPIFTPSLSIVGKNDAEQSQVALRYANEDGVAVDFVRVSRGHHQRFFEARRVNRSVYQQESLRAEYDGTHRGADWRGTLVFRGLLPVGLPADAQEVVTKIAESLSPLRRVQWIHANRLEDSIVGKLANGVVLATTLNDLRYRTVLEAASQWIREEARLADEIAIRPDGDGHLRFVLVFSGREPLPLTLAGDGIRSLAQVLLCACWAEWGVRSGDLDAPSLLAIEEPEMNLHPHLHVALFQRLLQTVRAGVAVLIETHSVYVLRAMQLAVLKNQIEADAIGLHWVSQGSDGAATVSLIDVKADASLSGWRPDVYEKEQELAHDILDARWKRLEDT